MKEYKDLIESCCDACDAHEKKLKKFHKKVIDDQIKGKATKPLKIPIKEKFDDATDLFTFIISDVNFTKRHIDPILKTKRKNDKKFWIKIAENGAKEFAKKAKLPKEWDFLFPKKIREDTAKKLMDHFKE